MRLKLTFIYAIVLGIISLSVWELYWRSQGKIPDIDDNKDLWAVQRSKVNQATANDVVLMGSSRTLFDFQLN